MTRSQLLSLNVKYANLQSTNFTDRDIRAFIDNWFSGTDKKLTLMMFMSTGRKYDESYVLKYYPNKKRWDPERRDQIFELHDGYCTVCVPFLKSL